MNQKVYAEGIFWNHRREHAPDFVIGGIAINKEKFMLWLDQQAPDEKGYVKIDVLNGREGKPYMQLNTYKK